MRAALLLVLAAAAAVRGAAPCTVCPPELSMFETCRSAASDADCAALDACELCAPGKCRAKCSCGDDDAADGHSLYGECYFAQRAPNTYVASYRDVCSCLHG